LSVREAWRRWRFLVIEATGNGAEYADIRSRLVALELVVDTALEELDELYAEQVEERDGRETP